MEEIIIVGGGRVGIRLIDLLNKREDYHITLIDDNKKALSLIKEKYETVDIVRGNATNKLCLKMQVLKMLISLWLQLVLMK